MKTTWLTDNIKAILALVIVILGFGYFYMCSIRDLKPDPQILIAFVSSIGVCIGYYFGSSSGSAKKDDALTANANTPTVLQTGDTPQATVNPKQTDTAL